MNEFDRKPNVKREYDTHRCFPIRGIIAALALSLFIFNTARADTASIDVLVVYTAAVKVVQTDHDGVVAAAQAIINKATLGFENSEIDAEFNLVHVEEIDYVESLTDYEDDLNAITDKDGVVDNVLTLREDWGADIVYLLRDGSIGGTAGLGWILKDVTGRDVTGFSVGSVQSSISSNTFTHEAGHNFGAAHDSDNSAPDDGLFLYSHGHHFAAGISGNFRTIMAYQKQGNIQVNNFSNPNVTHLGVDTGIAEGNPNPADNARTLTTSIPVVAGYRVHQTTIPSFPTPFPNLAFVEGQSKTIVSQAVGTPPLAYQWYEGVSGDTSSPISGATESSYTTPILNDTTVYWVRATNPNGSGDSPSITMTTTAAPTETNEFDPNHNPDDFQDFFITFSIENGETWQEFVPTVSYLHQIEIRMAKRGAPGRMSLKFTDENGVVLFSRIYEEGDIIATNPWFAAPWFVIPLQMYVDVGKTYRLTLQRLDTKEFDSILVTTQPLYA